MSETTDAVIGVVPSGYKETTLGSLPAGLITVLESGSVYPMVGDAQFFNLEREWATNADEIKSLPGETESRLRRRRGTAERVMRLSAETLTDFMAWLTGNVSSGAASAAADEVVTIDLTGITDGSYKIRDTLDGGLSAEIQWDADTAAVDAALEAIFGTGNVAAVVAASVVTITFGGIYAGYNYPTLEIIEIDPAVGGTFALTQGTTGAAADQYIHTIKEPSVCTLNPPSFPYVEGARCEGIVDSFKYYTGVVVDSVGFAIENDDFVNLTVGLRSIGAESSASSFSFPASDTTIARILGSHAVVRLGDDFTTSTYLVGSDELRRLAVTWNVGVVEPESLNAQVTGAEWQYPQRGITSIDVSATFKGGKSSRFYQMMAAADNNYRPKMRISLNPQSNPQRPIQIDFNQLRPGTVTEPSGREQRQSMTFVPESNSTDSGRFTLTTTTGVDAYLQTV